MVPNHPLLEHVDLLDGNWYASRPHDDWTWMRKSMPVRFTPTERLNRSL